MPAGLVACDSCMRSGSSVSVVVRRAAAQNCFLNGRRVPPGVADLQDIAGPHFRHGEGRNMVRDKCVEPSSRLLCVLVVNVIFGCGSEAVRRPSIASLPGPEVTPSTRIDRSCDLGVVWRGHKIVARHWIRFRNDTPIRVGEIRTSCECLTVHLSDSEIPPGGRVLGEFTFDSSNEPDFSGSLRIEVEIVDETGEVVAKLDVSAEVISDANDSSP